LIIGANVVDLRLCFSRDTIISSRVYEPQMQIIV